MNEKEKYVLDHYNITKEGKVYSNHFKKYLKLRKDKNGYYDVTLIYNNKGNRMPFRISRLVALKYIPNPNNLLIVNHKDLNKTNNNIENLEWSTIAKNTQHGYDNCVYKHVKKVKVIEPNGNILIFPSTSHISRYYNYKNPTAIQAILEKRKANPISRGVRKGLFFEYTDESVTTIERNISIVTGV